VNNQLKHKGYIGSIEASLEDTCLFGKVLFIKALVSYEGKTTCQTLGHAPEKPCKGSFNVRAGHDLHLAATRKKVTLNDLTRQALNEFLQHHSTDACPAIG